LKDLIKWKRRADRWAKKHKQPAVTLHQLSKSTGLARNTIKRAFSEKRYRPTLPVAKKLSVLTGIPLDKLKRQPKIYKPKKKDIDRTVLETWKRSNGYRYRDLAKRFKVSRQWLNAVFLGRRSPGYKMAALLSRVTEIPIDEIMAIGRKKRK
jgi:transcriptional regulator with XRE-family HTH domain